MMYGEKLHCHIHGEKSNFSEYEKASREGLVVRDDAPTGGK